MRKVLSQETASERLREDALKYASQERNDPGASPLELYGAALEFACAKLAKEISARIMEYLASEDHESPSLDEVADSAGRAALRYLLREARSQ